MLQFFHNFFTWDEQILGHTSPDENIYDPPRPPPSLKCILPLNPIHATDYLQQLVIFVQKSFKNFP